MQQNEKWSKPLSETELLIHAATTTHSLVFGVCVCVIITNQFPMAVNWMQSFYQEHIKNVHH